MKKLNLVIAVLLFFALVSCNKDLLQKEKKNLTEIELRLYDLDYIYNSNPYIIAKKTVENRENKDEIIQRIIEEMILKDKEFNYLNKLTKNSGYPIWNYTSFVEEDNEYPLVIIPFAKENSKQITTILYSRFIDDVIIFEFADSKKVEHHFKSLLKGKIDWENIEVSILSFLSKDSNIFGLYHQDYADYFFNISKENNGIHKRECSTVLVCDWVYYDEASSSTEVSVRSGYEHVCTYQYVCSGGNTCVSCPNEGCVSCPGGGSGYGTGTEGNTSPSSGNNYTLPDMLGLNFNQMLDNFASLYNLTSTQKNYFSSNQSLLIDLYELHNMGGTEDQRAQRMFNKQQSYNPIADLVAFSAECAVLKALNPNWPKWKVQLQAWINVKSFQLHLTLDIIGSIPGYGEPADLLNGIVYSVEGDYWNATISVGAAVGIGEVAKYAKYLGVAVKNLGGKHTLRMIVDNTGVIKFTDDAGNVILHEFGGRSKLRKVLKTGRGDEAHHLIPWEFWNHPTIQKAANKYDLPFHMNHPKNGMSLKRFRKNLDDGGVHANHPKYNKFVQEELNRLDINSSTLPQDIIELQNSLRQLIESSPEIKINELF